MKQTTKEVIPIRIGDILYKRPDGELELRQVAFVKQIRITEEGEEYVIKRLKDNL